MSGDMAIRLRFIGVSHELIKALIGGENAPQERYLSLMDYVQYNNPPYLQSEMEDELGIPQPSISRFFSVISDKAKVRFRLDFITRKIGLRTVVAVYDSRWIRDPPAIDWISSLNHAHEGTIMVYRVPEDNVEDLLALLESRVGEPSAFMPVEDFVYAKPSMRYYFGSASEMDPIIAYRYASSHPEIPKRYITPYRGPTTNVLRDIIDLSVLLYGEINSVYSHVRAWGTLSEATHQRAKKKILYHISHVIDALRGSKALIYGADENMLVYVFIDADTSCSSMSETLLLYLYSIGVSFFSDGSLMALLTLPATYVPRTISTIFGDCEGRIKVYSHSVYNVVLKQYLPVRNFSIKRRTWLFEKAPLLEITKRKSDKLVVDTDYAAEVEDDEYIEELKRGMGEEYVKRLLSEMKGSKEEE